VLVVDIGAVVVAVRVDTENLRRNHCLLELLIQ
jgi:hypothetical protein